MSIDDERSRRKDDVRTNSIHPRELGSDSEPFIPSSTPFGGGGTASHRHLDTTTALPPLNITRKISCKYPSIFRGPFYVEELGRLLISPNYKETHLNT